MDWVAITTPGHRGTDTYSSGVEQVSVEEVEQNSHKDFRCSSFLNMLLDKVFSKQHSHLRRKSDQQERRSLLANTAYKGAQTNVRLILPVGSGGRSNGSPILLRFRRVHVGSGTRRPRQFETSDHNEI